jgi:hypothetical protein
MFFENKRERKYEKMKNKWILGFGVLLIAGFISAGCTTISSSEAAMAFSQPIPVKDLVIGTFTYSTTDDYLVRPDGSLIPDRTIGQKDHEAYHTETETWGYTPEGKAQTRTKTVMTEGYHTASSGEVFAWAHRVAAENAGITDIIAIRTSAITKNKTTMGIIIPSQDITIMVYGKPASQNAQDEMPSNAEALE